MTTWRMKAQLAALAASTVALPFSSAICSGAIIVLTILWFTEGGWNEKQKLIRESIILKATLALFVWQIIGLLFADDLQSGISEIQKKLPLLFVPIVCATTSVRLTPKNIELLFRIFVGTCTIAALVCIGKATAQFFTPGQSLAKIGYLNSSDLIDPNQISSGWLYFSYVNLAAGVNMHPAYFSLLVGFAIVLLVYRVLKTPATSRREKRIVMTLLVFLCLFEIFLSTRIIIIALLTMGMVTLAASFRRQAYRVAVILLILLPLSLTALWLNPVSYYRNVYELTNSDFKISDNSEYRTSAEIRASLWWLSWKTIETINPVFGSGTGSVKREIRNQGRIHKVSNVLDTFDPHNQYLFYLIGNGIIGLALFLSVVALPAIVAVRIQDYLYVSFACLCSFMFLTESALELQKGIAFVSIIGSVLAFQRQSFHKYKLQLISTSGN